MPEPYWTSDCGTVTLYCGDCRDVAAHIEDVDTLFTSPPYNCGKPYGSADDNLLLDQFSTFLTETIFAIRARVFVVNVAQYIGSRSERVLFRDVLIDSAGWIPLVDEVIWDKGPANGAAWGNYPNSPRIRAQHESIYVFGNASMPNGNGLDWKDWSRLTTSIWRIPAAVDLSTHPAQMPVDIAIRAISLWSDIHGVVLDPFMGSGTTGVAAVQLGRRFIGIEISPDYCAIAKRRIEAALGKGTLFDPATMRQRDLLEA
jgi:site-specific DNA-methyltransferase (adenine-specific)